VCSNYLFSGTSDDSFLSSLKYLSREMRTIVTVIMDVVVGTAFVFDIFYGKIPNYLIIAAYGLVFPLLYIEGGGPELINFLLGIGIFGIALFAVYMFNGIGAGDVKLMTLICSCLGFHYGTIFAMVVFFAAAFYGLVRLGLALRFVGTVHLKKEFIKQRKIRFMIPVLAGYLCVLISRGGII